MMTSVGSETVSAICGIIGSVLLAIPSFRHEYARIRYKKVLDIPPQREETINLDKAIKEVMKQKALQSFWWSPCDSYSIFFGAFFLVVSFTILLFS